MNLQKCDCCGESWSRAPTTYRAYEFEEEFEYLCIDCAKEQNTLTPDTMSDEELIAAIVSDSIGYAAPRHAAFHVSDYRDGEEEVHCERGHACFDGDLQKLVDRATRHWAIMSDEKRERLLVKVRRWKELEDEDRIASMGLSMSVPVGGL